MTVENNHSNPAETPGEAALAAAIEEHGDDLAGALEHTDDVQKLIDTVILTVAAADDEEVEHLTQSVASLVQATDKLSTSETVALASFIGQHGSETASALETVLALERNGHLEDLLELGDVLAGLEIDETTVDGLNRVLRALEAAEANATPTGILGSLRATRTVEVRAGLGYLMAALRNLGQSVRIK